MSMPAPDWPEAEERIARMARTRRGRHRDRALASWRRTRALELRAAGMTYEQIAHEVGYANKGTAHAVIHQALEEREAASVDQLRYLELDRLNAMQVALWRDAVAGKVTAVDAIVKIIDARCRLLGLYQNRRTMDAKASTGGRDNCQGPSTVVVRADDCRHKGCERHGRFETA
jgi:hypothetical protein